MSKSKYCYVIANKENGNLLIEDGKLPLYWNKRVAKDRCALFGGYVVHKIELSKIENLVLRSKPI